MLAIPFLCTKLIEYSSTSLFVSTAKMIISLICPDYLFLNLLFQDLKAQTFVMITSVSTCLSLFCYWVFFLSFEKIRLFKICRAHLIKKNQKLQNEVRRHYREQLEGNEAPSINILPRVNADLKQTLEMDFNSPTTSGIDEESKPSKTLDHIVLLNLSLFSSFKVNIDDISVYVMRKNFIVNSMIDDCAEIDLRKFQFFQNSTVSRMDVQWFVRVCRVFLRNGRNKIFLAKFDKLNVVEQLILLELIRILSSINSTARFFIFAREIDSLLFDCQVVEIYRRLVRYKVVYRLPIGTSTELALAANSSLISKKPELLVQQMSIYSRKEIFSKIMETLENVQFNCESSAVFCMR